MTFKLIVTNNLHRHLFLRKCTLLLFVLLLTFSSSTQAQKLCTSSKKEVPANNIVFFENFSATKCMKMEGLGILPDSKVVLGECLYRTKASKDEQFQIIMNSMNRTTLRQDAGLGESYCLTTSSASELRNTLCNMKKLDQSWTLKPVKGQPHQFLIEQFSSKKCLKPKARSTGSGILLTTCNAHETEQIWKVIYSNPAASATSAVQPC